MRPGSEVRFNRDTAMEFGLSEEQRILQDSVQRFFSEHASLELVRNIAETPSAFDSALWAAISDLGILGTLVPEHYGGSGLDFFDAFIILQAAGRVTAPVPLAGAMVAAPVALLSHATASQRETYLPRLAAGESRVALAMSHVISERDEAGLSLNAGKLKGKTLFAIDAGAADIFLIAADSSTWVWVEAASKGVSLTYLPTVDKTRCVAEISFDNTPAEILGEPGQAGQSIVRVLDAMRIALAADTLGAAEVMVEKAITYAGEREQFNRPIGSFQAVKHMCADMVAALEPARALAWYAAHAFDHVPEDARAMACHARAHMAEVATQIARTAVEVHGGMGFTDLLGLHYWFKRIGLNRQLLGSPEQVRQEAAQVQGWV